MITVLLHTNLFRIVERCVEIFLDSVGNWQLIQMIFSDNFDNNISTKLKLKIGKYPPKNFYLHKCCKLWTLLNLETGYNN